LIRYKRHLSQHPVRTQATTPVSPALERLNYDSSLSDITWPSSSNSIPIYYRHEQKVGTACSHSNQAQPYRQALTDDTPLFF
jgi:hypothetical protein